ncbi:MAG: type VI secretion system needle protein Hcp [Tannerella sp.]|nr:type VI secretion system needle protein Hcp [Tannerella sp.]
MSIFNFAHVVAHFYLDGKEYEVEHFNTAFAQPVDYKGQPQHETNGGQITLTLTHLPDENLNNWAKRSTLLKSGEIVFTTEMGSPPLRVTFGNAYCIRLTQEYDEFTGTKTVLVIAPETVTMNGVSHTNYWPK